MTSGLAAAAFAAGLLGGVHCAGMCGGIAASLSVCARGPLLARQLAFNAGRLFSYACAGAVAGSAGLFFSAIAAQALLFALANVLMVLLGLYVAGWGRAVLRLESAGRVLWRRIEPLARRVFPIDRTSMALLAGVLWGWVPCGLVYSMLALALVSGGAFGGGLVMAAFGLGTLPTLLTAGLAAQKIATLRRHSWIRYPAALAIIAMGVAGLARIPGLQDAVLAGLRCFAAPPRVTGPLPALAAPTLETAVATRAIIQARRAPVNTLQPNPLPPAPGEHLPSWLLRSGG